MAQTPFAYALAANDVPVALSLTVFADRPHVLARLPWPVGLYLGLTGRAIGRSDAHWLGLATHCIASAHFPDIIAQLSAADPVDPILDGLHEAQAEGPLQKERAIVEDLFSAGSLREIMQRLGKANGANEQFAKGALADATTLLKLRGHAYLTSGAV